MYLKEITVPIPYDQGKVVIRNGKTVEYELGRTYSSATKDTRVQRRVIGKVDAFSPGRMYPNEHYFQLIENDVPEEIRESFLARCERRREIDTLKKNPTDMMEQVARGIETVKEHGKEIIMRETEKHMNQGSSGKAGENGGRAWFISDRNDLEYLLKVFRDLYNIMEGYATKFPGAVLSPQKVKMFNKILTELKYTLPDHRVIQCLEIIEDSKWETDEKGTRYLTGATYSDAFMQLTWYKNALLMP